MHRDAASIFVCLFPFIGPYMRGMLPCCSFPKKQAKIMNDVPKPCSFLSVIAICLFCAACASVSRQEGPEEIQEIRMTVQAHHGDLNNLNFNTESDISITRQRIQAEHVATDPRGKSERETRNFDMKTPENLWRQILRGCTLASLEHIEGGKSTLVPGDGEDLTLTVTTGRRKISFLNGHGEAYEQLELPCFFPLHCVYSHSASKSEISPEALEKACLKPSK
jgi:hypothetical protein